MDKKQIVERLNPERSLQEHIHRSITRVAPTPIVTAPTMSCASMLLSDRPCIFNDDGVMAVTSKEVHMTDISSRLHSQRAAVDELLAAIEKSASRWTQPSAPGKWSPSQVIEHVARTLGESAKGVNSPPSSPTCPRRFARRGRGLCAHNSPCSRTEPELHVGRLRHIPLPRQRRHTVAFKHRCRHSNGDRRTARGSDGYAERDSSCASAAEVGIAFDFAVSVGHAMIRHPKIK